MRGLAGTPFVTALLTLCAALYVLEMSGRWDQSLNDANDEAGVVAIVLCIGVAVSAAGPLLARLRLTRIRSRVDLAPVAATRGVDDVRLVLPTSINSPPLGLRV